MDEARTELPADAFPEYSVQRTECGRLVSDPLRDYRHTGPIAVEPLTTLSTVKPPRDLVPDCAPAPNKDSPNG